MSKNITAFIPVKCDENTFRPQLVRIIENTDVEDGYSYTDNTDNIKFISKECVFLIENKELNGAFDACKKYITDVLKKKLEYDTPQSLTFKGYVPTYSPYSRQWVNSYCTVTKGENGIDKVNQYNGLYEVPSKFVFPAEVSDFSIASGKCNAFISEFLNENKCKECKYNDFNGIVLRCASCAHSVLNGNTITCSKMACNDKVTMDVLHYKENTICKNFFPKNGNDWHGFEFYTDAVKNCYSNNDCGAIKRKSCYYVKPDTVLPDNIKLKVTGLFYNGKLLEYVWIPYEKWIDLSFIQEDKILTKFVQYKRIEGMKTSDPSVVCADAVSLKADEESFKARMEFLKSIKEEQRYNDVSDYESRISELD